MFRVFRRFKEPKGFGRLDLGLEPWVFPFRFRSPRRLTFLHPNRASEQEVACIVSRARQPALRTPTLQYMPTSNLMSPVTFPVSMASPSDSHPEATLQERKHQCKQQVHIEELDCSGGPVEPSHHALRICCLPSQTDFFRTWA